MICGSNKIYCAILLIINPSLLAITNCCAFAEIGQMELIEMMELSSIVILTMLFVLVYHVNAKGPDKMSATLVFIVTYVVLCVIVTNLNYHNSEKFITMMVISGVFIFIALLIHFSLVPGKPHTQNAISASLTSYIFQPLTACLTECNKNPCTCECKCDNCDEKDCQAVAECACICCYYMLLGCLEAAAKNN